MSTSQTHYDKTSADAISCAFDYQYYFFLYKLFQLNENETIGLEVKDDVHTELNNNIQVLIQLKHSIQKNENGTTVNFTTLDIDLWHTLNNWCEVITDENDDRKIKQKQIDFVKKTYFILITNKSITTNEFINNLEKFKNEEFSLTEFKKSIEQIKTKNNNITEYKKNLLLLDNVVLENFLKRIEFNLEFNDLISKCKVALKSKMIPENKIDELFKLLDSSIREDNYNMILNNQKVCIDFNDYYMKYRIYYDRARNDSLNIKKFNLSLEDDLTQQNFIQYLIDIDDISNTDIDEIIEFTKYKLQMENNVIKWLHDSELTNDEKLKFEGDVVTLWKNEFRTHTRGSLSEEQIKTNALKILDNLRKVNLKVLGLDLDIQHSNGQFYYLSDILKIGWRKDWKEKYCE